jgi:hypothetical protein
MEINALTLCLFSFGSSLVIRAIDFPSLRSFMIAKDRVHHLVSGHGMAWPDDLPRERDTMRTELGCSIQPHVMVGQSLVE